MNWFYFPENINIKKRLQGCINWGNIPKFFLVSLWVKWSQSALFSFYLFEKPKGRRGHSIRQLLIGDRSSWFCSWFHFYILDRDKLLIVTDGVCYNEFLRINFFFWLKGKIYFPNPYSNNFRLWYLTKMAHREERHNICIKCIIVCMVKLFYYELIIKICIINNIL